jgi:hypothetical protein
MSYELKPNSHYADADRELFSELMFKGAAKIDPRKSKVLDKHPSLKGKQSRLPDELQAKIIVSKRDQVKKAAKEDFTYNRDKLRRKTQQTAGRGAGLMAGTIGGSFLGKGVKGALIGSIGGGIAGAGLGHYLGPKGISIDDELLDASVHGALIRNRKNKGTGRNSAVVKDLRANYDLKVGSVKKASLRAGMLKRLKLLRGAPKSKRAFGSPKIR